MPVEIPWSGYNAEQRMPKSVPILRVRPWPDGVKWVFPPNWTEDEIDHFLLREVIREETEWTPAEDVLRELGYERRKVDGRFVKVSQARTASDPRP